MATGRDRLRSWFYLVRINLRTSRTFLMIFAAAVIAWGIFTHTRVDRISNAAVLALTWLPILLVPFWALVSGFIGWRQDFEGNHMHLLLPLPVSRGQVYGAKLAAATIEILLCSALVLLVGYLAALRPISNLAGQLPYGYMDHLYNIVRNSAILYLGGAVTISIVTQFTYIIGRSFQRLRPLIMGWVFLITIWFLVRFSMLVTPALAWLPPMRFTGFFNFAGDSIARTAVVATAPFLATALGTVLVAVVTAWVLDTQVEA